MWGADDIAAANAAIRLGAERLPPPGARIRWRPWSIDDGVLDGTVQMIHPRPWDEGQVVVLDDAYDRPNGRGVWRVEPRRIVCLLSIPSDAPPFDEWLEP